MNLQATTCLRPHDSPSFEGSCQERFSAPRRSISTVASSMLLPGMAAKTGRTVQDEGPEASLFARASQATPGIRGSRGDYRAFCSQNAQTRNEIELLAIGRRPSNLINRRPGFQQALFLIVWHYTGDLSFESLQATECMALSCTMSTINRVKVNERSTASRSGEGRGDLHPQRCI